MAKLYFSKNDGHPYIRKGFSVNDGLGNEVRFSTYLLYPRAETLAQEAGLVDGTKISPQLFYAWLLDGDIYNQARPDGIAISSIPRATVADVVRHLSTPRLDPMRDDVRAARYKHTLDYYRYLIQHANEADRSRGRGLDRRAPALKIAAMYTIYAHATNRSKAA